MAAEGRLSEDADGFERALASLTPCARGVDRDQLMFLAGKMSAKQSPALAGSARWLWPAATIASTLAAAVLGILFAGQAGREPVRESTDIVQELVSDDEEAPSKDGADSLIDGADQDPPEPLSEADPDGQLADGRVAQPDYLRLRRTALMDGVEALPLPAHSASLDAEPPASYWQSTQRLRDERANKYPGRNSSLLNSTLFFGFGEKL